MLSAKRDKQAAKRFFRKALKATHNSSHRIINVDKNERLPPVLGVNYFWAWRQLEQMFKSFSEVAFASTYN